MNNVVAILGPTASGKSKIALKLAKDLNGEIISCDSIQIYKHLDIASAKPSKHDQVNVKHHLIDILSPNDEFSSSQFSQLARQAIDDVLSRGKLPILCGGTGLFVKGLVENYDFAQCPKNEKLRSSYYDILNKHGAEKLYEMLKELNPEKARTLNVNDTTRIIRALEISHHGCMPGSNTNQAHQSKVLNFKLVALDVDRQELYQKINSRVDQMVQAGLFEEVESLVKRFNLSSSSPCMKGIGYKEALLYLNGEIDQNSCVELIKQKTRNYAKRQLTWFRHMNDINWFNPNNYSDILNFCK